MNKRKIRNSKQGGSGASGSSTTASWLSRLERCVAEKKAQRTKPSRRESARFGEKAIRATLNAERQQRATGFSRFLRKRRHLLCNTTAEACYYVARDRAEMARPRARSAETIPEKRKRKMGSFTLRRRSWRAKLATVFRIASFFFQKILDRFFRSLLRRKSFLLFFFFALRELQSASLPL